MNAETLPQLYMLRDPAETLVPEERVEGVRYAVSFEDVTLKGEKSE